MNKLFISLLGAVALSACGTTTIVREVPASTAPVPIVTAAVVNKYDKYYEYVLNNSGQANTSSKADIIEMGDLVCGALDKGNSIDAIVRVLSRASTGQSDNELYAAVVYAAITYLCDEYSGQLNAYLSN